MGRQRPRGRARLLERAAVPLRPGGRVRPGRRRTPVDRRPRAVGARTAVSPRCPVARLAMAQQGRAVDRIPGRVRVLTWNVWWRFGPEWRRRQPALLHHLRAVDPDVIALQECWGVDSTTQAHEF